MLIFTEGDINVSYNLHPACRNHLVLSPVKHYPEITDLTYDQVKSLFMAVKRLILFFEPNNSILFWFKGVGRKFKHFHAHYMPLIPEGFQEVKVDPILSFTPGIQSMIQAGINEEILEKFFKAIRILKSRENYTTVWKEGRGIVSPVMVSFPREKYDGLFSRSEKEKEFSLTPEKVFERAEWLRKRIKGE
ncbi:hypothetical protein KKD72_00290 [Patescibacteria group bacterium]|nr:hypothetical protein [Patescibacteria group bacterium]